MNAMVRFMSCILCLNVFRVFGSDATSDIYPGNSWTRREDGARNLARVYRDINAGKGPAEDQALYLSYQVKLNSSRRYQRDIEVGSGTYGHVYLGHDTQTGEKCAIKITEKRSRWRLMRELMIMSDLQGGPNIVKVMDVVNDRRSHQPAVILEFVKSTLYDASSSMTPMDIQVMLYKLLGALNFTHSKGYMHRDIKPRNVMVDINKQELRLVDWNIAERYIPGELYSMKCMTLPYKAPELLTNMQDYDYSLDMWGFGLSMATLIFNVNRLWTGEDKADQLLLIAKTMGTEGLYTMTNKYGLVPSDKLKEFLGTHPKRPWTSYVNNLNKARATPEALDLLDKLLRYDPAERLTAAEALQHPYFKSMGSAA